MRGDSASSGEGDPQPTSDQIPSQRELEAKIQCASTLLAWSTHRDNAQRLAKVWTNSPLMSALLEHGAVNHQELLSTGTSSVPHQRNVPVVPPNNADSRSITFLASCAVVSPFLVSQEGAVEAVLRLCKTDHLLLRGYCSAILKQFAATPILREKLVARGGVRK